MNTGKIKLNYTEPTDEPKYGLDCPKYVKAIYTKSKFKCDNGNFYLEALPKRLPDSIQDTLYTNDANIIPSKDVSQDQQLDEIPFLKSYRFPLTFTKEMENRFYGLLVSSYRQRIEDLEEYPETIHLQNQDLTVQYSLQPSMGADDELGFPLVGESGCGKSTAVKTMLSHYPQVILHDLDIGVCPQILYIYVIAPKNGSLQDLFVSICLAVDRALGNSDQAHAKACSKRKIGGQVELVCELIRNYAIGVIVMDELQLLAPARNKTTSYDSFLTITNSTKVGLMTIGTEASCKVLFDETWRIRRWGVPLRASDYCRQPTFAKSIIAMLMNINWFKEDFKVTTELVDTAYELTYGFINRILDLWYEVQRDYITSLNKPEITVQYLKDLASYVFRGQDKNLEKAIESNPLFTDKENEPIIQYPEHPRLLPNNPKKLVNMGIKTDREEAYKSFEETTDKNKALRIYDRCVRNIEENGNKYSASSIRKAVIHVMKLKKAPEMEDVALVQKCLTYLYKRPVETINKMPVGNTQPSMKILEDNIYSTIQQDNI